MRLVHVRRSLTIDGEKTLVASGLSVFRMIFSLSPLHLHIHHFLNSLALLRGIFLRNLWGCSTERLAPARVSAVTEEVAFL